MLVLTQCLDGTSRLLVFSDCSVMVRFHVYKIEYKNFIKSCSMNFEYLCETLGTKKIISLG